MRLLRWATWAVCLSLIPFLVNDYVLYVVMVVAVFGLLTLGLNILMGFAGQISIGHAGFLAIGAYTTALLGKQGISILVALTAAGTMAALSGAIMGFPALRLSGLHLAIATLAFGVIVEKLLFSMATITGGGAGTPVGKPYLGAGIVLTKPWQLYLLIVVVVGLLTLAARNLLSQKAGRALLAVKESEIAAAAMGVGLVRYKLLAFCMSAFYAGVAGGLYAHLIRHLAVETFNLGLSISLLVMVIIGGVGSVLGSFVGAAFVIALPEILRPVRDYHALIYGFAVLLAVLFAPRGLAGFAGFVTGLKEPMESEHAARR